VYAQPPSFNPPSCIFSSASRLRPRKAQLSPPFANRPPDFNNHRWKRANHEPSILYGSVKGVKGQYRNKLFGGQPKPRVSHPPLHPRRLRKTQPWAIFR
jgi:hypothetical protein